MADITTEDGGEKGIPVHIDMDTALRKLRALYVRAAFKLAKNRYKDVGRNDGTKWPINCHDPDGGRNWTTAKPEWLQAKLMEEVVEFFLAMATYGSRDYAKGNMLEEAGDTMNLLMMCIDNRVNGDGALPPKVVCICGSTKFKEQFEAANKQETLKGNIVLTVGFFMHHDPEPISVEAKHGLDNLHRRKIDLADEILVIDVGDYIGESTRREIFYANLQRKPVRFLSRET